MVYDGKAQAHLHSFGPAVTETLHEESFAFQEENFLRKRVVRDYEDEAGEIRQKADIAEDNMELTWRDNTGRPVRAF